MLELTYQECLNIDGGITLSTILTGLGITAFGFAMMLSTGATAPLLIAGFCVIKIGQAVAIWGFVD